MKTAYIYIRVSTDEQAQEGFSLANQKKTCVDYARSHEYHVKKIFIDDGKSGRTTDRPAFQELLTAIDEFKVDALIIYKIDRFARNVSDFRDTKKEIETKGLEMISVLEGNITQGSSLIANILASVAEWESEVNGQRTRDALMQKYREGWQPTPPPIGYMSIGREKERKTCKPDPYVYPIIVELFQMYATGNFSILEIQEWLASQNLVSKNGTGLGHSVIHTILQNPFYHGLIRWRGESKMGKHKPIITKDLFDTCQYVLAKHRDFLIRRRVHNFLLRGFLYCGVCEQRYTAEWHKNEKIKNFDGGRIAYYHCQKRDRNGCPAPYVEMGEIERLAGEEFKKLEFSKEFIEAVVKKVKEILANSRQNSESAKQAVLNQKNAFEARRNTLEDAMLDGTVDRESFKRKHQELQDKILNLDNKLIELDNDSKIDVDLIEEVLAFSRNIYKTYLEAPDYLKRHYLRFFFEKLLVKKKQIVEIVPTPVFKTLLDTNQVIINRFQLPNPRLTINQPNDGIISDLQLPR